MFAKDKTLDDMARVAGGAVSIFSGLRQEIRDEFRARLDEFAARSDLVPREDFEALEAQLKAQEKRIKDLENQIQGKKG